MKEIDPDVAALLDDLPPATLPSALTDQGWGQQSLDEIVQRKPRSLVSPSTTFQPTYNHNCVQCGRPITKDRLDYWTDHSGQTTCDNVLLDKPRSTRHLTQEELNRPPSLIDRILRREYQKALADQLYKKKTGPCHAHHGPGGSSHQCEHPTGHFGFHECADPQCRQLWL